MVPSGLPAAFGIVVAVFLALGVASVGIWVWGLVDAAQRPEWAYERSGSNKILWIILIAVLGAIPAAAYLLAVRPRVRDAEAVGPPRPAAAPPPPLAYCGACGTAVPIGSAYCLRCGRPL